MPRLSNDNADLTPRTEFEGPRLTFEFPGLEIGIAEYEAGPTGCTVFHFPIVQRRLRYRCRLFTPVGVRFEESR